MIIDLRTHLSPSIADPRSPGQIISQADHADAMACVDAHVVFGYRCERFGLHIPVEAVTASVNAGEGERLGVAGVDPTCDAALANIDKAAEAGLLGVTIAPADQGLRVTSEACMAAFERCALHELPVFIANPLLIQPESVLEFANPATLDEAMREIPNLKVILGDIGFGWLEEALTMCAKHERVYAEISSVVARPWSLFTTLIRAHERGVMSKLFFGSGFPAETPQRAIERIYTLAAHRPGGALPSLPREALRQLVERNVFAELGIDHLVPRRGASAEEPAFSPAQNVVVTSSTGLFGPRRRANASQ